MCESTIWLNHQDGHKEKIAVDVLIVRQDGPFVFFQGLLAGPTKVTGTILEVNAMEHTITLSVVENAPETAGIHAQVSGQPP